MCAHECGSGGAAGCKCGGGRIERFLEPCLLLLLLETPTHGYELLGKLERFGLDPRQQDPGLLYKTLRRMEEDGFLTSRWDTGAAGPAKRLYKVTEDGEELLRSWVAVIKRNRRTLDGFLGAYQAYLARRGGDKGVSKEDRE